MTTAKRILTTCALGLITLCGTQTIAAASPVESATAPVATATVVPTNSASTLDAGPWVCVIFPNLPVCKNS